MCPVVTPPGAKPPRLCRPNTSRSAVRSGLGPRGQPEPAGLLGRQPVPGGDRQHAGQGRPALSEQRAGDGQRVGRWVRDVGQLPVDLPGGGRADRFRPLDGQRPAYGCGHAVLGRADPGADTGDGGGRHRLHRRPFHVAGRGRSACTAAPSRGPPRTRAGVRVSSRTSATTSSAVTDSVTVRRPRRVSATTRGPPTARRQSFACRAALSAPQLPDRATASMAPDDAVAPEQQVVAPGQVAGLDDRAVLQRHLGAGGDVAAGLDHAVVAERDADAGVGADQAPLADADDLGAAAGERAHDRRAAADVGAVADDDARR